jgi:uncharacterized protein YndB with AHSA1/START domain
MDTAEHPDRVERAVTLPTDLEQAWRLLTEPDDQCGWLGREVVLPPVPGARGVVVDHDGTRRALVVGDVEVGRRLAWRWWTDAGPASEVEITLAPVEQGTAVRVVERPLTAAATGPLRAGAAEGWAHRLLHLEALLLVAAAVRG